MQFFFFFLRGYTEGNEVLRPLCFIRFVLSPWVVPGQK